MFGDPTPLDQGSLPTKMAIHNHGLNVRKIMERDGIWKHNTQLSEVAKKVTADVQAQWTKTDIPNLFDINPDKAERKIMEVLKCGKLLTKVPVTRRGKDFACELNALLDLSVCTHDSIQTCSCAHEHKVGICFKIYTVCGQIFNKHVNPRYLWHGGISCKTSVDHGARAPPYQTDPCPSR